MSSLLYRINGFLSQVVTCVPIGTNLGLCHLLWMLLSGRLRQSRGAVIPGRAALGLPAAAVRRAWAALAYGRWHTAQLVAGWQRVIPDDGHWHAHRHGGSCPVASRTSCPRRRASSPYGVVSWIPAFAGMTRGHKDWQCIYEMDI